MDRAIFGPLKKGINTACDNWMRSNAGKVMTIYDIPPVTKSAFDVAITARNISAGLAATGTWPVNTDIFGEADFLPSQVTDRILVNPEPEQSLSVPEITDNLEERILTPNPTIGTVENDEARTLTPAISTYQTMTTSNPSVLNNNANEPVASTSTARSPLATTTNVFSPESVRPLPKAPPRKNNQPNRRKIKSAVLTDTPTKD